MSDAHAADIDQHIRRYWLIGLTLLVLTVVTVAISYVDMGHGWNIAVALIVATVKGSLVACVFMHLLSERQCIYLVLLLTVVFFVILMFVPLGTDRNTMGNPTHVPESVSRPVH